MEAIRRRGKSGVTVPMARHTNEFHSQSQTPLCSLLEHRIDPDRFAARGMLFGQMLTAGGATPSRRALFATKSSKQVHL
jgi:hypothetical protein